jgi:hypothetical protein
MSKISCTWAILGGLVNPLGSTANPSQTKPGESIPAHMAKFAIFMCPEMWELYSCLSECVNQVGDIHFSFFVIYALPIS